VKKSEEKRNKHKIVSMKHAKFRKDRTFSQCGKTTLDISSLFFYVEVVAFRRKKIEEEKREISVGVVRSCLSCGKME